MSETAVRRTMARRPTVVLGAMLMSVTIAGCATATTPADPTTSSVPSTPVETPTANETPTPTPTVDAGDVSTWVVSETGMGPIELGTGFDEARAEVPAWTVEDACSWTAFWNDQEGSLTAYLAEDSEARDGVTTIDVAALTDTVEPSDAPRTAEGVGVGSTRDDVEQAYPDAVEQTATIGGASLLRVQGTIFFTFQPGSETVDAITVTSLDEPPYEVCA